MSGNFPEKVLNATKWADAERNRADAYGTWLYEQRTEPELQ